MPNEQQSPPVSVFRKNRDAVRITFWGVRGSIPTPGAGTVKFGGNTSCVELRADGEHIVFDAGSGARELGLSLAREFGEKQIDLTVLLTHTHWDHIQGFPFFVPVYQPKNHVRILGYEGSQRRLQSTLEGQMESPYFPVALQALPGNIRIEELAEMSFDIGKLHVRTALTKHPGHTVGYRVETSAGSVCYVPDHETAPGVKHAGIEDLIKGADVLMLDSQYTPEEYVTKVGWGHGCYEDVVRLACDMGVKKLYLFHHDPMHDDRFIEDMVARAREIGHSYDIDIDAAREGEQIVLLGR
jgi:phosphoribosyl 1,2-cyclic phosphodiesterase